MCMCTCVCMFCWKGPVTAPSPCGSGWSRVAIQTTFPHLPAGPECCNPSQASKVVVKYKYFCISAENSCFSGLVWSLLNTPWTCPSPPWSHGAPPTPCWQPLPLPFWGSGVSRVTSQSLRLTVTTILHGYFQDELRLRKSKDMVWPSFVPCPGSLLCHAAQRPSFCVSCST